MLLSFAFYSRGPRLGLEGTKQTFPLSWVFEAGCLHWPKPASWGFSSTLPSRQATPDWPACLSTHSCVPLSPTSRQLSVAARCSPTTNAGWLLGWGVGVGAETTQQGHLLPHQCPVPSENPQALGIIGASRFRRFCTLLSPRDHGYHDSQGLGCVKPLDYGYCSFCDL